MRVVRRTLIGRPVADKTIHARGPQLLKLPIPLPSIPILAPVVSPIVGGSNQNANPGTTTPVNPPPAQPTSPPSSPPSNGGGASPPSGSTQSPGGNGSPVPVPPVVPGSGEAPPSRSSGGSPTAGGDTMPSGVSGASPTSGSVLQGGGGVTPTTGSDNYGTNDPSASVYGSVANASGAPQGSKNSGGTYTVGPGDPSSTVRGNDANNGATASSAAKGHISTGAVAAIVVVFIALFLALLILLLRRRSKARRHEQANIWWFSRKRTSQTYGDRNSAEIPPAGSRSARSSFATTFDHSFQAALSTDAPIIPPLPPMAEVGRMNVSSLQVGIEPSHSNAEVSDKRFSIGSNHSESSQYLFVNLRNSLQLTPATGQTFSAAQSFAFPKPPSPVGDRTSAYSRPSSHHGTAAATIKRPNSNDSFFHSLPAMPTPSAVALMNDDPFASDPFGDNNPFEDPQRPVATAMPATVFAEEEVIRRPFHRIREDELTVSVGEYVRILTTFDDGWAYVVKVPTPGSGGGDKDDDSAFDNKGLIPIDCLRGPGQDLPAFIASKRVSSYGEGVALPCR